LPDDRLLQWLHRDGLSASKLLAAKEDPMNERHAYLYCRRHQRRMSKEATRS